MKELLAVVTGVGATLAFGAVTNIMEDVRLDADADWRGQGVVKLAEGATIAVKLGDRKPRRGRILGPRNDNI